eukprot:jgi/Mesvir1/11994/Mv00300-RA.1
MSPSFCDNKPMGFSTAGRLSPELLNPVHYQPPCLEDRLAFLHEVDAEMQRDGFTSENPEGLVSLAFHDNSLVSDLLARHISQYRDSLVETEGIHYESSYGTASLRASIASYLARFTFRHVDPEALVVSRDVSSSLQLLINSLAEARASLGSRSGSSRSSSGGGSSPTSSAGEGGSGSASVATPRARFAVLTPSPIMDSHIWALSRDPLVECCPVPVTAATGYTLDENELSAALARAESQGLEGLALLLTNPSHQLGRAYSAHQLRSFARFAMTHGLHLISDETFASHVFMPTPATGVTAPSVSEAPERPMDEVMGGLSHGGAWDVAPLQSAALQARSGFVSILDAWDAELAAQGLPPHLGAAALSAAVGCGTNEASRCIRGPSDEGRSRRSSSEGSLSGSSEDGTTTPTEKEDAGCVMLASGNGHGATQGFGNGDGKGQSPTLPVQYGSPRGTPLSASLCSPHVVSGLGKLGSERLRMGAAYIGCPHVLALARVRSRLHTAPLDTQQMMTHVLAPAPGQGQGLAGGVGAAGAGSACFVDELLATLQSRLAENYDTVVRAMDRYAIPFLRADAGASVWLDLRAALPYVTSASSTPPPRAASAGNVTTMVAKGSGRRSSSHGGSADASSDEDVPSLVPLMGARSHLSLGPRSHSTGKLSQAGVSSPNGKLTNGMAANSVKREGVLDAEGGKGQGAPGQGLASLGQAFAAEDRLLEVIRTEARVLLASGGMMHSAEPGWFRLSFGVPAKPLGRALARLGALVRSRFPAVCAARYAERLDEAWRRTDVIFSMLGGDKAKFLHRPIGQRHPFLFYLGHLPAFAVNMARRSLENALPLGSNNNTSNNSNGDNKLSSSLSFSVSASTKTTSSGLKPTASSEPPVYFTEGVGSAPGTWTVVSPNLSFDELFERGIDPDVDTGTCHAHSAAIDFDKWPSVKEVAGYRDAARALFLAALHPLLATATPAGAATSWSDEAAALLLAKEGLSGGADAIASANESKSGSAHALPSRPAAPLPNRHIIDMVLEHELMHQETLMYMFLQEGLEHKQQPRGVREWGQPASLDPNPASISDRNGNPADARNGGSVGTCLKEAGTKCHGMGTEGAAKGTETSSLSAAKDGVVRRPGVRDEQMRKWVFVPPGPVVIGQPAPGQAGTPCQPTPCPPCPPAPYQPPPCNPTGEMSSSGVGMSVECAVDSDGSGGAAASSEWGWDNEFGQRVVDVGGVLVQRLPVSNANMLQFLADRGYERQELWEAGDWAWREREGLNWPMSWVRRSAEDSGGGVPPSSSPSSPPSSSSLQSSSAPAPWLALADQFCFRSMFRHVPLADVLTWPAIVSQAEASAYARWLGDDVRLLTEPEWLRAVYADPAAYGAPDEAERQLPHPWGRAPMAEGVRANVAWGCWSPAPIGAFPAGDSCSGLVDTLGSGWEWTGTPFGPHPGFALHPAYPGYSADFFDGKHFVMLGGSWATDACMLRPSFRNWFQSRYPYMLAKFRCCRPVNTFQDMLEGAHLAEVGAGVGVGVLEGVQHVGQSSTGVRKVVLGGVDHGSSDAAHKGGEREGASGNSGAIEGGNTASGGDHLVQFAADVLAGLSSNPKRLSSLYFYDDAGSEIFAQITELDEYYPTRCEAEILASDTGGGALVAHTFAATGRDGFNLVELGAGDGRKTRLLLERILDIQDEQWRQHDTTGAPAPIPFSFMPIDVSEGALESLAGKLSSLTHGRKHNLDMTLVVGDSTDGLRWMCSSSSRRNLVLFLGSSLGNLDMDQSGKFLRSLYSSLNEGDLLLVGFDLRKDIKVMQAAYDDARGVTAAFNYNLLTRINRELGADFDVSKFQFYSTYDAQEGAIISSLVSKEPQTVRISGLPAAAASGGSLPGPREFFFDKWEAVFTERSVKYTMAIVHDLAARGGFEVVEDFYDSRQWFVDSLWRVRKTPVSSV